MNFNNSWNLLIILRIGKFFGLINTFVKREVFSWFTLFFYRNESFFTTKINDSWIFDGRKFFFLGCVRKFYLFNIYFVLDFYRVFIKFVSNKLILISGIYKSEQDFSFISNSIRTENAIDLNLCFNNWSYTFSSIVNVGYVGEIG